MNNTALDKIIKRIVLPKYPWITDHEISEDAVGDYTYYRVNYFVTPDENGTFTVSEDMEKVEDLTINLFELLGPDRNQMLEGVNFY